MKPTLQSSIRTARRLAYVVPVVAMTSIPAACGTSASAANTTPIAAVTIASDDIATVVERTMLAGPIISGTLTPRVQAIVRAEVGGAITATYAERGSVVAAGAPLARVQDRTLRESHASALAAVRTAESSADVARRKAGRLEMLLKAGAVSAEETEGARQEIVVAESDVAAARARLSATADELAHATVRSPIAGVVSARSISAGDVVQPGAAMFEVLDPSTMRLEAAVPSAQLATLRIGAVVQFSVTGYPGRTFTGRVERVSPAADAATRQVPVVVAIDNRERQLVAGLYAEGRINAESRSALLAPAASVDAAGGSAAVMRLRDGRLTRVSVEPGARHVDQGLVEIRSGLQAGDTILVGTAHGIKAGATVKVRTNP